MQMTQPRRLLSAAIPALAALVLAGCWNSSSKPGKTNAPSGSLGGSGAAGSSKLGDLESWEDYPDVPKVPVMTDVDGIPIPRIKTTEESLDVKGKVPVDVGNEWAKKNPGEPTTGDWLTVRFNSEPKTLNPMVETSAVQQYIGQYVQEGLATLNPESQEYEPHIAERWVAEDSVKLGPDYAGQTRRIALEEGKPETELEIDYQRPADPEEEPPVVTLKASDGEGRALEGVWVGFYPVGKVPGAPVSGYHFWSGPDGAVAATALASGKYRVRVGSEIYGKAKKNDDGSLTVTPLTAENPLNELLRSGDKKSLTLSPEEWADVQAQTIYTYYLRDDVTWSDGAPFTTKDLEFAYAVINNPAVDADSLRVYYADLVEAEALGERVMRMKYRQQYFKAFEFTAGLSAYAPPWHFFEEMFRQDGKALTLEQVSEEGQQSTTVSVHGQEFGKFFNTDPRYNDSPLGTGPYAVDKWVRADRVEIRRNPDYWRREKAGHLDKLIFKFIPDDLTAMQALKAGEIDFLYRMSAEQYFEDLKGPPDWFKDRYVKANWYSPGFSYYGWNMLRPIFKDRRVRIALALLFDSEEFFEKKLYGAGLMVSGAQYYFGPGYDHEVKPIGYDPQTAADLLADAGWVDTNNDGILDKDGKKFTFELLLPQGQQSSRDRAAILQENLKEAGIQMTVRDYEWASFIDKVKARQFDVVNLGWASPIESDPFQIFHGSEAGAHKRGSNAVSFSDPLADELIDQLRVTLDEEKRKRIHWSLHRILDREQPYMFLYTPKDFGAYHRRFQGVKWYRVRPGFDFTEWYVPKDQQVHKG